MPDEKPALHHPGTVGKLDDSQGGWDTVAPSAVAHHHTGELLNFISRNTKVISDFKSATKERSSRFSGYGNSCGTGI
jgi:hypothetical protein